MGMNLRLGVSPAAASQLTFMGMNLQLNVHTAAA